MAMAERVVDHSDDLSRLWPGFWPPEQPFILYAPRTGAVFAGAASPEGPSFRAGPLEGADFRFSMDFPTGAPNTMMVEVGGPDDTLETMFHEQFHDFQNDTFVWQGERGGEYVDLGLIPDLTAFTVAVEVERRVLIDALAAPDAATRRELARAYLALRRAREQQLDPYVIATERNREWMEGTAQYVGTQASVVARNGVATEVRDKIITSLRSDLLSSPEEFVGNMFRWRAYGVGAALAWLLDDIGVPEWRLGAQAGTPLDVLLEGAVGIADATARDAVRSTHDIEALGREVAPVVAVVLATPRDRAAFLATAPRLLVIELDLPWEQARGFGIGHASAQMIPLPNDAVALPNAMLVSAQTEAFGLQIVDHSVLIEHPESDDPGRHRYRFTILLPDFSGLEALVPGPTLAASEVEIEGITLKIPADASIERDERAITVRIRR